MTGKRSIVFSVCMALAGVALLAAYMFAVTPAPIRNPQWEHAHFRLALTVQGEPVHFGAKQFQNQSQPFCTDELSEEPIHFHDHKNNFVHLHWKGMTGGLVLKNYGWNLIGGHDDLLGYRADRLPLLNKVPIYGDVLPQLPKDARLWVYTSNNGAVTSRDTQAFLNQDLETFFGRKSLIGASPAPDFWRDALFSRASAHAGETHTHKTHTHKTQAELTRINNLLGDVAVFVQAHKPQDAQVKEAFEHMEPLIESTCGG